MENNDVIINRRNTLKDSRKKIEDEANYAVTTISVTKKTQGKIDEQRKRSTEFKEFTPSRSATVTMALIALERTTAEEYVECYKIAMSTNKRGNTRITNRGTEKKN